MKSEEKGKACICRTISAGNKLGGAEIFSLLFTAVDRKIKAEKAAIGYAKGREF
ncbi:MAG: hypothetical protein ACI4LH_08415 [Candidatus Heritagella sp.]